MRYDWDPEKDAVNRRKHGFSLEEGIRPSKTRILNPGLMIDSTTARFAVPPSDWEEAKFFWSSQLYAKKT